MMVQPADIRRLLDAFEQSDWDEIRLSVDGTDVFISARDDAVAPPSAAVIERAPAAAVKDTSAAPAVVPSDTTGSAPVTTVTEVSNTIPDGEAVCSPSPGIFWRSPSPGAPPFVEVGQRVEADTVVCIVEVMKLMNQVTAGVSGTVAAILVENSGKLARGQPMVIIAPNGAEDA